MVKMKHFRIYMVICFLVWQFAAISQSQTGLVDLLSTPDCLTSCWLGITPGVTSETEMVNVLTTQGILYERNSLGMGGSGFTYEIIGGYSHPLVLPNFADSIVIYVNEGLIAGIDIRLNNVFVNDVISAYGAPTRLIDLGNSVEIAYAEEGIVFSAGEESLNPVFGVRIVNEETVNRAYINTEYPSEDFALCSDSRPICGVSTATPIPQFTIPSISLLDSSDNTITEPLNNNAIIDLATVTASPLRFRANSDPATVGSVKFELSGSATASFTDDTQPYDFDWTPAVGSYTLTATPYSGAGGTGNPGSPLTINFTVIRSYTGGPNSLLYSYGASSIAGHTEMYFMNPDGTNKTALTNTGYPINNVDAAWSPNGSSIAFASSRDGDYEIFSMNANGTNLVNLTVNTTTDRFPSWSPDGSKLVFASMRDGNWEIYVMNADGSNPIRLTNQPNIDYQPVWSPDGSSIAFTSRRDGNYEIYRMNTDGTNLIRLTNRSVTDDVPVWSPDSTKIAFASAVSNNIDIYVMNADGTNIVRLTTHATSDTYPDWSPDGSQIVFSSQRASTYLIYDLYIMNANGTNQQPLTSTNIYPETSPVWGHR